jgi:hypothetical protein
MHVYGSEALSVARSVEDEAYELLDIDTLFYIDNNGMSRLLVNLNGYPFKLVTDQDEVHRSVNAFLIPLHGEITINIAEYIVPGDNNIMYITSQGPPGSEADLIIGDLLLPGQQVAYAITGLQPIPGDFELIQGYPNPFQDRITFTYNIPESRITGLHVNLAVYDVTGRRVALLVDDVRFPGSFTVTWDARDAETRLASGVYFCRMTAGDFQETVKLVRIN